MTQINVKELRDLLGDTISTIDGLLIACPDMPDDAKRGTETIRAELWEFFIKIDDDNTN